VARERVVVEIGGREAADLYPDLAVVEVEAGDDAPATFRLSLAMSREADGAWRYLDEERFRVWSRVAVRVGFEEGGTEEVVSGYVTRVRPRFDADETRCTLEVEGMDAGVLLDREEKLKDWPGKKDSDIAREVLGAHGLGARVEETEVVHDEALSTIIQRETDLEFLKRLALRNGFACWVEGTTGHFRPLPADPVPQPVLAAHFGAETSLAWFAPTVDALRPAEVAMFQVDRLTREVLSAGASAPARRPLGRMDAAALLPGGVKPAMVYVARNAATGAPEMTALCQGVFDEGAWFASAEGETRPAAYAHVLKPRGLVTVKGVGESYSGVWYVAYVRHALGRDGYTQFFRLRRDALLPTGTESFASPPGGGLL
jgi:phage protein D